MHAEVFYDKNFRLCKVCKIIEPVGTSFCAKELSEKSHSWPFSPRGGSAGSSGSHIFNPARPC